jgi:hypothetical protein
MDKSRRSFLKMGSIAAGTLLAPGIGGQQVRANKSKNKSRFRGNLSNPIPASRVRREKNRIINNEFENNDDPVPSIEMEDIPAHHNIVAFNFDVIEGTPTGWVGVVADPAKDAKRQSPVARIHEKADRNARATANKSSTTENSSQSTNDDWGDWNDEVTERNEIVDDNGNESGYDIKWKSDPEDFSNQGIEAELRLLPQETDQWSGDWQNRKADPYFGFNGSVIDNVSDYGPGNSVGSNTETISLSVSSDKTVEVGASKSNTSSDIDIDNQSDTYGGDHYVNQRFSISGDLKWNTVRVNQGATTVETDPQWDTQYCDMDLMTKYEWGECCKISKITYDYNVGW